MAAAFRSVILTRAAGGTAAPGVPLRGMAAEFGTIGIRTHVAVPQPGVAGADVASLVVFLAGPGASYATGTVIQVGSCVQ